MLAGGVGRPQPTNVTYHVWKETEQIEALKICLELGLDINAQNQWGQAALHGAAFHDDARVIEFLAVQGRVARRDRLAGPDAAARGAGP